MSTEFITEYYPNGNKHVQGYYDGTNPAGDFTLWYENGNKCWEGFDVNSDGSLYMSTSWYENGQMQETGDRYDLVWSTGLWTEWYENGNKKSEGCYLGKNKKYSDPMVNRDEFTGGYNNPRTGKWSYWHSNGQLACTGIHHSDSVWIFWDEEGKKVHECEYRELELLDVWNNLRADGCSDELIDKYKKCIFDYAPMQHLEK